ncbi:hypothetical protein F9B85_03930 [Heliorestis acidaminivorans]|uniref:Polysaccharide chain length determinant N-terminal domain-containing protein n=1 Tax=Heliorestis acidaminivorans TaxID=553427 RepID=A0A6I0EZ37_9FIRM|nr:GNVR domain-containing protein [Heliorestis acidaminivorans]KAB2953776.1 hypothetical protein F9B85_03930 [Heliorestis acidaminivorans]
MDNRPKNGQYREKPYQQPAGQAMYHTSSAPAEDEIDLRQLFGVLNKWKWLIAMLTFLSFLTAAVMSYFVITPVYESRATLLILQATNTNQLAQRQGSIEDVVTAAVRLPELTLQSYANQIRNEEVAQSVIEQLDLHKEYSPRSILSMISASVIRDTNLLELRVTHTDPLLARDIANAFSQEFVDYMARSNVEKLIQSGELLEQQSRKEEENLQIATQRLNEFLGQPNNPYVLEQESKNLLESLRYYRNAKIQSQVEIQQLQAQATELSRQLQSIPPYQTVNSATTYRPSQLNQEAGAEALLLADLGTESTITNGYSTNDSYQSLQYSGQNFSTTTPPEQQIHNPAYQSLNNRLAEMSASLAGKRAELVTIDSAIFALEAQWKAVQEELAFKQTEYERLKRDVDRISNIHNLLADTQAQTRVAAFVSQGETQVKIASLAGLPGGPVKPNKSLNMALGLLVGLMISVALAFVLEMMDNTIKTQEDVRRRLGLPVLGTIPKYDKNMVKTAMRRTQR